jgi:SAM-dependent methyltransferase
MTEPARDDAAQDTVADAYDRWHAPRAAEGTRPEAAWHLLADRHLGDVQGLDVLEIGCGVGEFTQLLAERGARVTGADISRLAADATAARVARFPEARALSADICALPFADASFDLTVSLETIEHSPDPRVALGELVRVTRPGGRVIVTNPNYVSLTGAHRLALKITGRSFSEMGQPVNHWTTLVGTRRTLKRLGCRIDAVDGDVFLLPVPFWRELDVSFLDRPHALAKWFALHGLVAATRT